MPVAGQAAGICLPFVRDRACAIGSDDLEVKVHHALSGNRGYWCPHPMGRVAYGAGEAIVYMARVLAKAGIAHDIAQFVTLRAQPIIPIRT
jgi:hypothetical protein